MTPATGRTRRGPILVVVLGLLGAAFVAGRAHPAPAGNRTAPADAAQAGRSGVLSAAWYCPGLPSSFPDREQTVTLSNIGGGAADAVVTVHPDDGSEPVARTIGVPGHSVRTLDRATLAATTSGSSPSASHATTTSELPAGPIVVEPLSPDVVVSAGLESADRLDQIPCATSASTNWYFAAGTTLRGVSQWLVLDNPFSTDARVDVAVRSEAGLRLLPDLQGIDVAGRSRVVVPVHDQAVRQARVAIEVHAALGKVVASQTLQFTAASGPTGVASTLGALAPAERWWFADGRVDPGASQYVALTDLGPLNAHVVVQALIESGGIVDPVSITVPSDGVSWVRIGDCERSARDCLRVPSDRGYQLVLSDAGVPIVAQTLSRFGGGTGSSGATTSTGSTAPARRWIVPRTHVVASRSTSVSLVVPGLSAAHVSVDVVHDGRVDRPDALQDLTVDASARRVLPSSALPDDDAALVITSDEPIIVESTIHAARDATRAPGIPAP